MNKRSNPTDAALRHPSLRRASTNGSIIDRYTAGFNYSTQLVQHTNCVNALQFNSEGRWLASGGDDCILNIYNCFGNLGRDTAPVTKFRGAKSNIFTISFSCDNTKLFSSGMDETILMHDLERGITSTPSNSTHKNDTGGPDRAWYHHEASVRRVGSHPINPFLFLSASEDGTIRQTDLRSPSNKPSFLVCEPSEFNDAIYHPLTPQLFAACDGDGRVSLIDSRSIGENSLASEIAAVQYETWLCTPSSDNLDISSSEPARNLYRHAYPETSSLAFDPSGKLLMGLKSEYLPTLYSLNDPTPLATFSSPMNIEESTGYSNSCTIKNGSFSPSSVNDDLFYTTGSDDFRAYVWKIPDIEVMKARRENASDWKSIESWKIVGDKLSRPNEYKVATATYSELRTACGSITVPASITTPSHIITSHQSIVNTSLFHPTLPLLFTSGIEKAVHIHSGSPFYSAATHGLTSTAFVKRVRRTDGRLITPRIEEESSMVESIGTLEYFDSLLVRGQLKGVGLWNGMTLEDEDDDDDDEDDPSSPDEDGSSPFEEDETDDERSEDNEADDLATEEGHENFRQSVRDALATAIRYGDTGW